MSTIHFLNVGNGDCSIIQHNSGRVSMIDTCGGNQTDQEMKIFSVMKSIQENATPGNFGMADYPTRPQDHLRRLGITDIWRFILTHPDMDHLDGFSNIVRGFTVHNFWHAGAMKEKPEFGGWRFNEDDWDEYQHIRDGKSSTKLVFAQEMRSFQFANEGEDGKAGGDGLQILAPTQALVDQANKSGDFNDCSYVIRYRSGGFTTIFAGDSHDRTWEHILKHRRSWVENCDLLIAPHHGRHSGRSWEFLDVLKPRVTLFGYARSEHLAYDAWNNRGLYKITNNQAGNIIAEIEDGRMSFWVENDRFVQAARTGLIDVRNALGYASLGQITEVKVAA